MNFNAPLKPTVPTPADIHISIDLETASTASHAAIIQLAAATVVGGVRRVFEEKITLASNEAAGRTVDKETMEWWNAQNPALRRKVFGGTAELKETLEAFTAWCTDISGGELDRIHLWGNGSEFDCVILRNAYEAFQEYPFNFRKHKDLRTILYLTPADVQEQAHKAFKQNYPDSEAHDALSDATYQLYKILAALKYHHGSA